MYDLGIIGAGSAGYVAAELAGKAGMKVVLFDKRALGGVCLNEGCIPTKTLLYSAKMYENAKFGEKYGIVSKDVSYDFPAIMARKNKVIKKLVGGDPFLPFSGVALPSSGHNRRGAFHELSRFTYLGTRYRCDDL